VSIESRHDLGGLETQWEPPGKSWVATLAALISTFVALACYGVVSSAGELGAGTGTAAARTVAPTVGAAARSSTSAPARPASASPAGHQLDVVTASAFGPEGTSDGDNPGAASRIIDVSTGLPWSTQWYATPEFGDLRSGTGLLLTLGKTSVVRDVQLVLGSVPGADVQVRVGNSPSPDLPAVASASGVGGTVRLALTTPATGRYVLIWFTRLPPDEHGHYQVNVYSAAVNG
jgi:hypothetical protein